ncbi:MAG: hypothetical protein A2W28_09300 [Gammaproteobacteria bacterium RBG_16_51_14]|nr:MAG: hypothetical protein A2W28_09300 [Gammaproteobacteria bacterium RBG_16_51_14]
MSKCTCMIYSILLGIFSAQTNAGSPGADPQGFTNSSLKGFHTVAINIDPPDAPYYADISRYGVSKTELEKQITQRLQGVGINVISLEQALEDPAAALIELRLRVVPNDLYYSIGLNLSVRRKAALAPGSNAYYSVETWSDGLVGGLAQTDLPKIYIYTSQIVDRFIAVYQTQN